MFKPIKDRTAVAFLLGFTLCYITGAILCFNILMTFRFQEQDAITRSVMWMYTAWSLNDWAALRIAKSPYGKITIP